MTEEDKAYFQRPRFHKILAKYEEAIADGRSPYLDADELTDIAEYYMAQEQEERATQAIELAVELHPNSVDPLGRSVRKHHFHNELSSAEEICDSIPDQGDREVKFVRAEILIKKDLITEAQNFLLKASKVIDEDKKDFYYDCAGLFMDYNLWDEALVWADIITSKYPRWIRGKVLYAQILVSMGNYEKALPLLLQIIDTDPYNLRAWNMRAESFCAVEKYEQALEMTEFVFAIDPDNIQGHLTRANCLFHLNQLREAHLIYDKVIRGFDALPDTSHAYTIYLDAICLAKMKQYGVAARRARLALKKCEKKSPERLHILYQNAYIESKLHHLDVALEYLEAAKKLSPYSFITPNEYLLEGEIYLENNESEKAEEAFRKAVKASSYNVDTLISIAIAYGEYGDIDKAIEKLENIRANFSSEEIRVVFPYLAYFYKKKSDVPRYLHFLELAVAEDQPTTEYLFAEDFPDISVNDYFLYAYQRVYGYFPKA